VLHAFARRARGKMAAFESMPPAFLSMKIAICDLH
jgi:hypothetical protein